MCDQYYDYGLSQPNAYFFTGPNCSGDRVEIDSCPSKACHQNYGTGSIIPYTSIGSVVVPGNSLLWVFPNQDGKGSNVGFGGGVYTDTATDYQLSQIGSTYYKIVQPWEDLLMNCCLNKGNIDSCGDYWGEKKTGACQQVANVFCDKINPEDPNDYCTNYCVENPSPMCDKIALEYCQANKDDKSGFCNCINSQMGSLAYCLDNNCVNSSAYQISSQVGKPCDINYQDCQSVINIANNSNNNVITGNNQYTCCQMCVASKGQKCQMSSGCGSTPNGGGGGGNTPSEGNIMMVLKNNYIFLIFVFILAFVISLLGFDKFEKPRTKNE